MSKLKEAVQSKLKHFKSRLGHPNYSSDIEQNACECLVREFEYLDSIVEFEEVDAPVVNCTTCKHMDVNKYVAPCHSCHDGADYGNHEPSDVFVFKEEWKDSLKGL